MEEAELLSLLSNSYGSSNETRKSSIIRLFEYIETNFEQFLGSIQNILQNKNEIKLKFLSLSLIRHIYQNHDQENDDILIQNSETLIQICISLFQTEIAAQSGATIAEIIIFLYEFEININEIIQHLIDFLQSQTGKTGIFEFFSIICDEIEIDPNFYLSLINFITNPQFLDQNNQKDIINGIQLLPNIILKSLSLINSSILTDIINFLLSAFLIKEYKSSVYLSFAFLVSKCDLFQQVTFDQFFFDELIKDLTNGISVFEICYFLRKSIKNNYALFPTISSSSFFFF